LGLVGIPSPTSSILLLKLNEVAQVSWEEDPPRVGSIVKLLMAALAQGNGVIGRLILEVEQVRSLPYLCLRRISLRLVYSKGWECLPDDLLLQRHVQCHNSLYYKTNIGYHSGLLFLVLHSR